MTAKKTYGPHGLSVTLWREHARIRAQWRVAGRRQKRSWANTPDNWRVALWRKQLRRATGRI